MDSSIVNGMQTYMYTFIYILSPDYSRENNLCEKASHYGRSNIACINRTVAVLLAISSALPS